MMLGLCCVLCSFNKNWQSLRPDHLPASLMQIVLQPLSLGTSNDLVVGQHVYALGNPFGLDHSLTTGKSEIF